MVNYLLLIFIFRLLFLVNKYTKLTVPAKLSYQQIKKKVSVETFSNTHLHSKDSPLLTDNQARFHQ